MIVGTGKDEAGLFEGRGDVLTGAGLFDGSGDVLTGAGLFDGVGEVLTTVGVLGNRRFQVAGPVMPSGVKPAACWNPETALAVLSR